MAERGGRVVGLASGLNSEQFTVPATDDKGHGVRDWVRVPPSLHQEMENVISSKAFPYRNRGELMRHAIFRHLKWLAAISPTPITSVMAETEAIMEMCRFEDFHANFHETVSKLVETVNRLVSQGDAPAARRLVLKVNEHVKKMSSPYWRNKFEKVMQTNFGYLINSKLSLNPNKAVDDDSEEL